MLAEMTRAEKAELLRWIVRDLSDDFPGIESKPDVMGGVPCITRTRIPVWLLEQARRLGTSEADLLRDYPTLTVQDLANAWNLFALTARRSMPRLKRTRKTTTDVALCR